MSEREHTLHKVELPNDLGKSIFPTFNINVPMPEGTAVPPSVQAPSTPSQAPQPAGAGAPSKAGA